MAMELPPNAEVQDIQFKVHDKFTLFSGSESWRGNVDLLTTSNSVGLLFLANPNVAELKVIILKELAGAKDVDNKLRVRSVPLPAVANVIACSADGTQLAVNCTLHGVAFLNIYSVSSFVAPEVKSLQQIRISSDENVTAIQLLWNPVISNNIAVVNSNGSLSVYTLHDGGNFEMFSLDKSHQVKCGCWSPKGKQIVLGFPMGKLQQFKPDLTPAKTIPCPAGFLPNQFDTIAVHWLSTYQFIVAFLQRGDEQSPQLYIVNAPKGAAATYRNYYDVCYSSTGPRRHQITFTHVPQWNLLLIASANGVEVGVLGTNEGGESPTWMQYMLLDEARIETPMVNNCETFPMGFALDTSASHQLIIGENRLPIMPMIHLLSTNGMLLSYNFLNLRPGVPGICSPPPPIADYSGQFVPLTENISPAESIQSPQPQQDQVTATEEESSFVFTPNAVTSTPAVKEKTTTLFGGGALSVNMLGGKSAIPTGFATASTLGGATTLGPGPSFAGLSATTAAPTFGGFGKAIGEGDKAQSQPLQQQPLQKPVADAKPLYTVSNTFPAPVRATAGQSKDGTNTEILSDTIAPKSCLNGNELGANLQHLMIAEINGFNSKLELLKNKWNGLVSDLGFNDMAKYTKRLNDLQEINDQANDREFQQDVHGLQCAIQEAFAMLSECRNKLEVHNNPDVSRLTLISTQDPMNDRQLSRLKSCLAANEIQMEHLHQLIDAQWSNYQDMVHRNSKSEIHVPCMDVIYQRLIKLKDMVQRHGTTLKNLKDKLQRNKLIAQQFNEVCHIIDTSASATMESLANSILSMNLSNTATTQCSFLPVAKINTIRQLIQQQKEVSIIRPQRPARMDLNSNIILETKLLYDKKAREQESLAKKKGEQSEKLAASPQSVQSALPITGEAQIQTHLAKPTATKPATPASSTINSSFMTPVTQPNFNFGNASPFVKTATVGSNKTTGEDVQKPTPTFSSSTFGVSTGNGTNGAFNFNVKSNTSTLSTLGTPKESGVGYLTSAISTPISFSAKVVGGGDQQDNVVLPPTNAKPQPPGAQTGFAALSGVTNNSTSAAHPINGKALNDSNKENLQTTINKPFTFGTVPQDSKPNAFTFGGLGAAVTQSGTATSTTTPKFTLFDGKASSGIGGSSFTFSGFGNALNTPVSTTSISTGTATGTTSVPIFGGTKTTTTTTPSGGIFSFVKTRPEADTTADSETITPTLVDFSSSANQPTTEVSPGSKSKPPITNVTTVDVITTAVASTSPSVNVTNISTSNATDSILDNLKICTPKEAEAAKVAATKATTVGSNVFSGLGATTGSVGASEFSFTAAAASLDISGEAAKPSLFGEGVTGGAFSFTAAANALVKPAPTVPVTSSTTPVVVSTAAVVSTSSTIPTNLSVTNTLEDSKSNVSGAPVFGTTAANTNVAATTTTTTTTTSNTTSIFGGTANFFPQPAVSTTASEIPIFGQTTSELGGAATTPSRLFSTSVASPGIPSTTSPLFGSTLNNTTTQQSGGNLFSTPKIDQSVFGSATNTPIGSGSGIFAAAAAANPSPFGSPTPTNGTIFGGGTGGASSGFGFGGAATAVTSPFGTSATATASNNIFGGANKSAESSNLFGTVAQSTGVSSPTAVSGGSLFAGQSTFGQTTQTGNNMFGSQPSATSNFGTVGSIFGGSSVGGSASGTSIFGGSNIGSTAPSGFGAFSATGGASPFGSSGGGGSFAQGGASVAQSGFGSPQQNSSFTNPVFGVASGFGSPPTFGSQPSFGGAPSFGSPKGFASFGSTAPAAATSNVNAFGSTTQGKSNLFEALGSADAGLSFGNLAQASQTNVAKPTFGGSSFMNYRS